MHNKPTFSVKMLWKTTGIKKKIESNQRIKYKVVEKLYLLKYQNLLVKSPNDV